MKNLLLVLFISFNFFNLEAASLKAEDFIVDKSKITSSGKRAFKYYKFSKAPFELKELFPLASKKDRIAFHKFAFKVDRDISKISHSKLKDPAIFKKILKLTTLTREDDEFIGSKPLALGMKIKFKFFQSLFGALEGDDFISIKNQQKLSVVKKLNIVKNANLTLFQNFHYFSNVFKEGNVTLFFYPLQNGETLIISYAVLLVKASTANSFIIGRMIKTQLDSKMNDEFLNFKENRYLLFE
ncbi:hypothetical protein A9Q84_16825 [Halobacteriovorax marinus]|uniref:Secreted protein n=1 Tax=Halobacteriovorax marinus TaxID=97084 RepID=A0A1Y5F4J1_9BACT|nr:hypothetical protein A9Q84_16825 [Halobacteriovorax marinus]